MASGVGYASGFEQMRSPGTVNLALGVLAGGCLVETLYRGKVHYTFDGAWCMRSDGTVSSGPFTNIDAQSPEIDALMTSIGAGTTPPSTPRATWSKCCRLWNWCRANMRYAPGDPTYEAAQTYLMASGWPAIQRIAETFDQYGFVPWGTCMSRAQLFTTLLYRTGVSKDELGICESVWKFRYSQHMYTGVFVGGRWIYLDPTYIHLGIPAYEEMTSVPASGGVADYCHPGSLKVVAGAALGGVPVLMRRAVDSAAVLITTPPDGTWTTSEDLVVAGIADAAATAVRVNGVPVPVTGGAFTAVVPLTCGVSAIVVEVDLAEATYSDAIDVGAWCRGDLDWDGDVDADDFAVLANCFAGPDAGPVGDPFVIAAADRDEDGDVDLHDFAGFQLEVAE
jgi:hypothetical protein